MDGSPPSPPSMEFSRQEYWSGLPFPSPGDLPNPAIEAGSPALLANSLPTEIPGKHWFILSHNSFWGQPDPHDDGMMTWLLHF